MCCWLKTRNELWTYGALITLPNGVTTCPCPCPCGPTLLPLLPLGTPTKASLDDDDEPPSEIPSLLPSMPNEVPNVVG